MTWFRLDDQFHAHPKVLSAGNAAVGLYCRLGAWIADKLTDGFIPEGVAKSMGSAREIKALTTPPGPGMGSLLTRVEGGYLMGDYLEYNPSREKVLAEREAAKKRMQKRRGSPDVRPNEQANLDRSSDPPDPVPPAVVSTDSSPPRHGPPEGGEPVDKRTAVARAYGLLAARQAKNVGDVNAYAAKAAKTGNQHPDLERYLTEYPDAPADAIAAWLHGDKHSMRYYTPATNDDGPDADVVELDKRRTAP